MEKNKKENLKTVAIIVLVLVVVFGGSFFASELSGKSKTYNKVSESSNTSSSYPETEDIPEDEQGDFNDIDIDEYLALKKGSEKSIIFIARPDCSWCQLYTPVMKNIVYLYGIKVNHLNTNELTDEGKTKLLESDEYFNNGYGTPLTLIVQNDEIVDIIEGYSSKEDTITFFKNNGIINE